MRHEPEKIMGIFRTFEAPKGYAIIYRARAYAEASKLAKELQSQGRVVALVYSHNSSYAVYAQT
jgi:hypothetical protein